MLFPPCLPRASPTLPRAPPSEPRGSPTSAIDHSSVADQDRWLAPAFASRPVPLPIGRILGRTGVPVAGEAFVPAKGFARSSRLQSADRRGARPRDNKSRNTLERPPRCTRFHAAALHDKSNDSNRATRWRLSRGKFHQDLQGQSREFPK